MKPKGLCGRIVSDIWVLRAVLLKLISFNVPDQNSWCLFFFYSFNKEKLHSLLTERCYPVSYSFIHLKFELTFLPHPKSFISFYWLSLFCSQYSIHPFVLLLWILLRRWRGGTGTKPSDGGLWNLWSCPGWSTPAVLIWSPKATCMVRWRSACTPDRYNPYHKPEFIQFLLLML